MQKHIYRWLIGLGMLHAMGGILLVFILDTPLAKPYLDYLAQHLVVQGSHHAGTPVMLALFGPTVASWVHLILSRLCDYYYTSGKAMVKWLELCAIFVWLLLDSTRASTDFIGIGTLTVLWPLPAVPLLLLCFNTALLIAHIA